MKICYVTENFHPKYGGQYKPLKNIIQVFKKEKFNVGLLHSKLKIFKNKKKLILFLKKFDIIHIFGGWTKFYIIIHKICVKLKKKIVLHPMGFFEPWSINQKKLKKKIAWFLYQESFLLQTDLIHCASHLEEANLKKLNNNFKTIVIPLGIEKKFISKSQNTILKKKALYFSRFHKKKGLDILIEAWSDLDTKSWNLHIVGTGDTNFFKKKIINLKNKTINLKNKTIFQDSQKKKLFSQYDFLVLPSMSENFGLVILESLARGLPVLTTNETPWNEIEKKGAGWIINYSLPELKIVLSNIFKINSQKLKIKQKNSIKIARKYIMEILFKKYLDAYNKLLQTY